MIPFGVDSPQVLGVMEIGVFLGLVLFGVVALQAYLYFHNCHSDRLGLKLLAGSLFLFEFCHSLASCLAIYDFTIIQAGIPENQKRANSYALSLTPIFETVITALVQGFFAYRIWILSGRIHLSLICWILCTLRFVGGIAVAVEGFLDVPLEPDYYRLQDTYGWLITSALNVGVAVDLVITLALCWYFRQMYYTPFSLPSRSEQLLHRLIVWTIQTGLITSMMSVAVVITFQTMKRNFIWLALYTFLAKLYSNSFFVSINSRHRHRELMRAGATSPKPQDPSRSLTPNNLTIQITRTTEVDEPRFVGESTFVGEATLVGEATVFGPYPMTGLQVPEKAMYSNKLNSVV